MLTSVEAFWLQWQAEESDGAGAAQARAWLAAINGRPEAEAAPPSDEAAVERFRQRGLAQLAAPSLQDLEERAARDNRHVSGVAETALRLFDMTQPLHRLRPAARRRLGHAARLHHLAGRTPSESAAALEALPPSDLNPREHARLLALLRASGRGAAPDAKRPAKPDQETKRLAALLQLADALDYDQVQATRLDSAALTDTALVLRVRGLGAPAAARRVRLCRRLLKAGMNVGLRVTVAPPTLDEVRPLVNEPLPAQATVAQGVQRGVASALLAWQAALELALTGVKPSLMKAERDTAQLRQVLGVFRPVLKRKATQRLRQRLELLQHRLRAASEARAVTSDALTYAATLTAEGAAQLQPLLEALDHAGQAAFLEVEAWLRSAHAAELCEDLLALVGEPPLRNGPDTTLRHSSPGLLKAAAETIVERQQGFEASDFRQRRRLSEALVRGQAMLEVLGGAAVLGPAATALATDMQQLEQRLEGLRHLAALDEAVGRFLDEWALRQAKRKAPQLSGVDAVLAYRHRRRTERQAQLKTLTAAFRPVQGRALATRVKLILAELKAGA